MMERRWIILAIVFAARTSMGYQFQSIGSVGPLLVAQMAIDFAVLGGLIGVYKLPGVILAFPSGLLGNRFGEKSMLVLSMAVMATGGLITMWAESYEWLLTGRLLAGAGGVLFNVLSAKMIADWFADKELTLALAIHVNSWPFGIALGLATQAALADAFSVNAMFAVTAGFCVLGMLLLSAGARDFPRAKPSAQRPARRTGLTGREFVLVSLAAMVWLLFNASLIVVISFAPSYLTAIGYDVVTAGQISSFGTWMGVLSIPLGGLIAQRWISGDRFMAATFPAGAIAAMAIIWLDNPLFAFIAFGVLAWAPAGPIFTLPVAVLTPANRAVGMGVFLSYYYLGIGLFSPLAGYLRDLSGNPAAPIIFAASLLLAALAMLGVFRAFERMPRRSVGLRHELAP